MSDIGILSGWQSLAVICLIFGAPGAALGAIIGALGWPCHRIWGIVVGAMVGLTISLSGMWVWVAY